MPPRDSTSSLIFLTTFFKTSVPICGFCKYKISSGAPNSTKVRSTCLFLPDESFTKVLSFPSEKVPAPPSPNCTLHSGSRPFPFQNASTLSCRFSTSKPRSKTTGCFPALASSNAANIPAGPKPAITVFFVSFPFRSTCSLGSLV